MPNKPPETEIRKVPDAPYSTAGDDFHVLWAVRKSLELINFDAYGLKRVSIEGPNPEEAVEIDETGRKLLAIDLTEYYGGETFLEASKVVLSQLKYSTTEARLRSKITVAKLCEKHNEKKPSVLAKLALSYGGFYDRFGAEAVREKVIVKLVTNRDLHETASAVFRQVHTVLKDQGRPTSMGQFLEWFDAEKVEVTRLVDAIGLPIDAFVDFLQALDFSDCSAGSREIQNKEILTSLAEHGFYEANNQLSQLHHMVFNKMLPEQQNNNSVNLEDLLLKLGTNDIDRLFPARSRIVEVEAPIERQQMETIAESITKGDNKKICLHGAAGVGKSTIVSAVGKRLSSDSVTIVYDCYGEGTYRDPSKYRHTTGVALKQMANELAQHFGSPLWIKDDHNGQFNASEFSKRLNMACEVLGKSKPDALLCLIIDASDNAVSAAKEADDQCFVHALAMLTEIPENCRLVFSCRTHRKPSLKLPNTAIGLQIDPFTHNESTQFLRKHFPAATDAQVQQFHNYTNGVPRVQFYALEGRESLDEVFDFLMPNGATVESIIDQKIEEAIHRSGVPEELEAIIKGIAYLPRPVPVDYVAHVSGTSIDAVRDFCSDVTGIFLRDDHVRFGDEDLENHLQERYSCDHAFRKRISETLIARANDELYAARNLANALYNEENFALLRTIVLDEQYQHPLDADPLVKKECLAERARLALKSCSAGVDTSELIKLLILCDEFIKTNTTRFNLISEQIDLVSGNTANSAVLEKLFDEVTRNTTNGATHLTCAASFSRNEITRPKAEWHLRRFDAWWRHTRSLEKGNLSIEPITDTQYADAAEAILRLYGMQRLEDWLWGFKSAKYRLLLGNRLTNRMMKWASLTQIEDWYNNAREIATKTVIAIRCFWLRGQCPIDITSLAEQWMALSLPEKPTVPISDLLVSLIEVLLAQEAPSDIIRGLLDKAAHVVPDHVPRYHGAPFNGDETEDRADHALRILCLKEQVLGETFTSDDLLPLRLKREPKGERKERDDRKEFTEIYSKLIPMYRLRAEAVSAKLSDKDLISRVDKIFEDVQRDYNFTFRHDATLYLNQFERILIPLAVFAEDKGYYVEKLIKHTTKGSQSRLRSLQIAASAVSNIAGEGDLVLCLLSEVQAILVDEPMASNEVVSAYTECCEVAKRVDEKEALVYFEKAVQASEGVDREAFENICTLFEVTQRVTDNSNCRELAQRVANYIEDTSIKMHGYDHLPWDHALLAVENLDFSCAQDMMCYWGFNERYEFYFRDQWNKRLINAMQSGLITMEQGIGLSTVGLFYGDWLELEETVLPVVSGTTLLQHLKDLERDLTVHCEVNSREGYLEKLVPLIEQHGSLRDFGLNSLSALQEFLAKTGKKASSQGTGYEPAQASDEEKWQIDTLLDALNPQDPTGIEVALSKLSKTDHGAPSYAAENYFFDRLLEHQRMNPVSFLNALLEVDVRAISSQRFHDTIKTALSKWNHRQAVQRWREQHFEEVLSQSIMREKSGQWGRISRSELYKLAECFGQTPDQLSVAFARVIPNHIDSLEHYEIHDSIAIIAEVLSDDDAKSLLRWLLDRWENEIHPANKLEFSKTPELQDELDSVVESLRYLLAHPYKHYRWRAAHAIVRLANYGDQEIIKRLIEKRDSNANFRVKDKDRLFYRASAKMWLFITLDRVAMNAPKMLIAFSKVFMDEALQAERNHAQTRFFAKRICQKLHDFDAGCYTEAERAAIEAVLIGRADAPNELDLRNHNQEFDFNAWDTIDHWFRSLERQFSIQLGLVTSLAKDHIIIDLGFEKWMSELRVRNDSDGTYSSSNYKGQIPSIETPQLYFEYHGMQMAANTLIEHFTPKGSEYYEDPWDEWLKKWVLSHDKWLSDYRDATPLDPVLWNDLHTYGPDWKWAITFPLFLVRIFNDDSGEVIVRQSMSRYQSGDYESCTIESALIDPGSANAALTAFQLAQNQYEFYIPELDSEWNYPELPFELIPWLNIDRTDRHGETETDPFGRDVSMVQVSFAELFIKWLKEQSPKTQDTVSFINWSDISIYRRGRENGTIGYRQVLPYNTLLNFLSDTGLSLFLSCKINRCLDREDYTNPYFLILVVHADGTVQTLHKELMLGSIKS